MMPRAIEDVFLQRDPLSLSRMPVPYRDNPPLTCGFVKSAFRGSRIPCPQNCPVKVPYTLHTNLSRER